MARYMARDVIRPPSGSTLADGNVIPRPAVPPHGVPMPPRPRPLRASLSLVVATLAFLGGLPPVAVGLADGAAASTPVSAVAAVIPIGGLTLGVPTYDGANGNLYVPGFSEPQSNGTLLIVSGVSNTVVARATVGWEPGTPTVDPNTGDIYVPNFDPGCLNCPPGFVQAAPTVSVISATSETVAATLPTAANPNAVLYDPVNGNLYVVDNTEENGNGTLTVIAGATHQLLPPVTVGAFPTYAFFDPPTGDLYVLDQASYIGPEAPDQLSIVNTSTGSVVGAVPLLGTSTGLMLFDPASAVWYVGATDGVSVVSALTNRVVTTLSVDDSNGGFVGPDGDPYLLEPGAPGMVEELSSTTGSVAASFPVGDASAITYDPTTGDVYTTDFGKYVNVTSLSSQTMVQSLDLGSVGESGPWGYFPSAPVYDPGNGLLYVTESGSVVNLLVLTQNATAGAPTPSPGASPLPGWEFFGGGLLLGVVIGLVGTSVRRRRRGPPKGAATAPPAI